jgi:type VI secretion system protein ImpB
VRPPRVHVTTDVETGDAIQIKELPFVVGVLGDFMGQQDERDLRDRKFVEITPDNFDSALKALKPRITGLSVENKLEDNPIGPKLKVDLSFESLEDFEPQKVAQKVPALNELLQLRTKLSDLKSSLQGNVKFEELLHKSIEDTEKRSQLANEIGPTEEK